MTSRASRVEGPELWPEKLTNLALCCPCTSPGLPQASEGVGVGEEVKAQSMLKVWESESGDLRREAFEKKVLDDFDLYFIYYLLTRSR